MRRVIFLLSLLGAFPAGGQSVPGAKTQAETLMNAALPFAERMLGDHGEFYPYAMAMKPDGEITAVAGYDGREHPPSQEIIDFLTEALRKDAASRLIVAAAIVWDARVRPSSTAPQTDAIAVALDHRDNYSVIVYFPYTLSGKKLSVGEPFAEAGHGAIFVH
jgi:hypothetical protein